MTSTESASGGHPGEPLAPGPVLRILAPDGSPGSEVPLEVARTARERGRGLLGRDAVRGALLLSPASAVHTLGMRFAIDVAFLDREWRVRSVRTMRPGRLGLPRPWARHVLEAEAGAMAGWGLAPGTRVAVEDTGQDANA
ncbi:MULTISPECIES: DUF192 domain-containing protein [unclassified Streptomyces]|uniref:DUF192 domain-containing protein n=1 Tax=unclassified Streptomyces TaxID=2593676 RepID=UPI00081D5288|nr:MULTISPECIES: DUF192 domain-containing protein [unclassified Streptomyces]MYR29910.1 DUF192 domain-containing protein [Streptomyces sp. SID4945]SCF48065.1 hypothetical protein GA0115257_119717 [Streptomyces sp. LcepLS]